MTDEITKKIDEAISGIKQAQDLSKRNGDRLDKLDALDEEKFQKIADDVTKIYDAVDKTKSAQEAIKKETEKHEKMLCRNMGDPKVTEVCGESKAAFLQYLRRGKNLDEKVYTEIASSIANKALLGADESDINLYTKKLVVGNNPEGGYFVRPEVANFMIDRIFETSPMRSLATIETIGSEALEIPIDDGEAEGGWVGEIDTRPVTGTPTIGMLTIHAHELYANPKVSLKMLDDAGFDVESWLQRKVADIFSRKENTSFVIGNGSKQPRGFTTYDPWAVAGVYERGKLEQRKSGAAGDFSADNLIELQYDLLEEYQANATWVMKRKTFANVMKLKDGEDNYLLNFQMLSQSAPLILLGQPVKFFDDMAEVGVDKLAIAYGDFRKGYTIVDRIGIRVLRDPLTNKPYVLYYTTKRTGGDVTNYQAIKLLKLSA